MITVASKYQIMIHVWPGPAAPMIRIQCGMKSWGSELWASITCKILSHKSGCYEGSTNAALLQLLVLHRKLNETHILYFYNRVTIIHHHFVWVYGHVSSSYYHLISSHHAWVPWVWGQGRLTSTSLYLIQDEGCDLTWSYQYLLLEAA